MTENLVRAEFHCHTVYSPDSLVRLEDLLAACRKKGIDRIAITDHNRIEGAFKAREMDPGRVITAEEIETTQGEILGYFMNKEIPSGLKPMDVVERLKAQGAFISVAHPFDPNRGGRWEPGELEAILPYLDAIEVFNARCIHKSYNEKALQFANLHSKGKMAGSDAHSTFELGRAFLCLPAFETANQLRQSLKQAEFEGKLSGSYVHLFSAYAKARKKALGQIPSQD
ncbi:MAG: PHP domain-containing protein [Anaerolineaceae bacterium]